MKIVVSMGMLAFKKVSVKTKDQID